MLFQQRSISSRPAESLGAESLLIYGVIYWPLQFIAAIYYEYHRDFTSSSPMMMKTRERKKVGPLLIILREGGGL